MVTEKKFYDAVFTYEGNDMWHCKVPEIKGCFTHGRGIEEALENTKEVLEIAMTENGILFDEVKYSQIRVTFILDEY